MKDIFYEPKRRKKDTEIGVPLSPKLTEIKEKRLSAQGDKLMQADGVKPEKIPDYSAPATTETEQYEPAKEDDYLEGLSPEEKIRERFARLNGESNTASAEPALEETGEEPKIQTPVSEEAKERKKPARDPFETWIDEGKYRVGNGKESYEQFKSKLSEYLEIVQKELEELKSSDSSKGKTDTNARKTQLEKLKKTLGEYYSFYDTYKNDMGYWKSPEDITKELALIADEKNQIDRALATLGGKNELVKLSYSSTPQTDGASVQGESTAETKPPAQTSAEQTDKPSVQTVNTSENTTSEENTTSTKPATAATQTPYTPPTAAQAARIPYWLKRHISTYNFRDVNLMIPKMKDFVKRLEKEFEENSKKYLGTSLNHIYTTRTEQIEKAEYMVQWYIEYINSNYDEVKTVFSDAEIKSILTNLESISSSLGERRADLYVDKIVRGLYKTDAQWYAHNNYEQGLKVMGECLEEIGQLEEKLTDYKFSQANTESIEDIAVRTEKANIERRIESLMKKLDLLEEELCKVSNAEFKEAFKKMVENGLTYADLEAQLAKAEQNIAAFEIKCAGRKYSWDKDSYNSAEALLEKHKLTKNLILAQMREFEKMRYDEYRRANDWSELSKARIPDIGNDKITDFLNKHLNDPYYYINNIYGMREYHKKLQEEEYETGNRTEREEEERYLYGRVDNIQPADEDKLNLYRDFEIYDHMTTDEIEIYNYLYHKLGKSKAKEYLKDLVSHKSYRIDIHGNAQPYDDGLNYRWGVAKAADDNFFEKWINAGAVGLQRFGIGIAQLFSDEEIPMTKDEYRYEITLNNASGLESSMLRGFEKLGNETPSFLLGKFVGLFNSVGEQVTEKAIGFLSSAGDALREAKLDGYSEYEAFNYASLYGASEMCFGVLIDGINEHLYSGDNAVKQKHMEIIGERIVGLDSVLIKVAEEFGENIILGTEEYLKDLMAPIFETWIFDESLSVQQFNDKVEKYLTTELQKT